MALEDDVHLITTVSKYRQLLRQRFYREKPKFAFTALAVAQG
jgi:hypothetical protein